jgi:formylglycine-generating enzyme required for sulfatase activity
MPDPANRPRIKPIGYVAILAALVMLTGCKPPKKPSSGMAHVPKGEFIMGSNEIDKEAKALQYGFRKPLYANEHPRRNVMLRAFHIDRTETTNIEYHEFVDSTRHKPPKDWLRGKYPEKFADHPVVNVSWHDADVYCKWRKKRLPTEEEWEKAARGTDGRKFPWGDEFDIKKVNALGEYEGAAPAGKFPEGASPYGALDMSGNVMEWTSNWYEQYPENDFNDKDYGEQYKVVRGGGWGGTGHYALQVFVSTSYRNMFEPEEVFDDLGFRCAKDG